MEEKRLVLCDTDVLVEVLDRQNDAVRETLLSFGYQNVAISAVTAAELLTGATDKAHLSKIFSFINGIVVIQLTSEISEKHLALVYEFGLSHHLRLADALIAATALVLNMPFYTLNTKHFKYIKGMRLV